MSGSVNAADEAPVDWHRIIGFSRVRRVGPLVLVSGSGGVDADGLFPPDAYRQTVLAIESIRRSLESVGADGDHLIGTRIFVRDIGDWQSVGRAHGEMLGHLAPTLTMVQAALVDPGMLVEIEATAWVPDSYEPGGS